MTENQAGKNLNIEGGVQAVAGENLGTVNQYIINQKSDAEIRSQPLKTGSPYVGLSKFEAKDKDKFFGRDRWIIELTDYLEENHVLLLLGASGSGKSSLIQAGLIPALEDGKGMKKLERKFCGSVLV